MIPPGTGTGGSGGIFRKMNNSINRSFPKAIIEYFLVALSGVIYIFQCSSWTSPLYPYAYGYDSSWYSLMGRAITAGKVPYRDYFDLKGPSLFFYEAFGQLFIKGRNGIFLIQCISIILTAILVWKTGRLFFNRILSAVLLLLYYYGAYALIWGGNTVEELFMPCSMAAVYLTLDYILNEEKPVTEPENSALIFGVGFGIFLFSKVTVAAVICASLLTVFIMMVRKKKWDVLRKCAINFLIGNLFIAVPLFIYFTVNGALKDFIYCSFLFAFKRSTDYYEGFSISWERNLIICYASFLYGLFMKTRDEKERDLKIFILITAFLQFILLHLGTPYLYYFLSQMPVYIILFTYFMKDFLQIIRDIRNNESICIQRITVLIIAVVIVLLQLFPLTSDKFLENIMIYYEDTGKEQYFDCKEIAALVPEWERDDIYNLESGMIYYEINQDLPSNRYPVNLPYFLHLDPSIKTDVMNKLQYDTPKWIISERLWDFDDEDVKKYVFSHYEIIAENDGEELYRLLDE